MTDDAIDDRLGETVAFEELAPDHRVRPLDLVVDRLADVVEQTRALHRLRVVAGLRGENPRDVRDLDRVTQDVLAVRRTEVQPAKKLHQIRMQATDPDLVDGGLGRLLPDLVDLGARLRDHLLDPRRVDPAIDEQTLEGALRDLAADRVESGDDDGFRRVVDDQVDAREGLERSDVATLAADDPALHIIRGEGDDGDAVLRGVLRGIALERHGDDVARPVVRSLARFRLQLADLSVRKVANLLLDPL